MADLDELQRWLHQAAVDLDPVVAQVHLFGSVLRSDDQMSDVDAVLVFSRWEVRRECNSLKMMFRQTFGFPLHIQMFHVSQVAEIEDFLKKAGASRRVI